MSTTTNSKTSRSSYALSSSAVGAKEATTAAGVRHTPSRSSTDRTGLVSGAERSMGTAVSRKCRGPDLYDDSGNDRIAELHGVFFGVTDGEHVGAGASGEVCSGSDARPFFKIVHGVCEQRAKSGRASHLNAKRALRESGSPGNGAGSRSRGVFFSASTTTSRSFDS